MRDAFIQGLCYARYSDEDIEIDGNTVEVHFNEAKTKQPYTNIKALNYITQRRNKFLCNIYNYITEPYEDFYDKLKVVKDQSPLIYNEIMNIGRWNWIIELYKARKLNENS